MDLPGATCLWGAVWRQLRHGAGQHAATGEYNQLHLGVLRYIWTYRREMRPKVLANIEEHAQQATIVTLTSRRQVRHWLSEVTPTQPRS